ncbi:hypothetical protein ALP93_05316 [Pseudomonas syringae pv. helianthi]|nr:hypothetical protein ALP93_05316 [Pseudomonas syringae pv. helianthi]
MRHQVLLWKMKIAVPAPDAQERFSSPAKRDIREDAYEQAPFE